MEVHATSFCADDVERLGMGAGVVPLALDPNGTFRVLLGRERFLSQWKGSCRWSGFEGSRKHSESMCEAAVREYTEESLGVLRDDVAERVQRRAHWIRIVLRIHNERRAAERYHATYVVPVQWDADAPARFLKARLNLEHVDRAAQEWRYARPEAMGEGMVGVVRACGADAAEEVVAEASLSQPRRYEGEAARGMLEWQRLRERAERCLVDHPGVTLRRCEHGLLQDVHVNRDHLEKDQVRWWSAAELREVLASHGRRGPERFRPYFLPVLQTLLQELDAAPPPPSAFFTAPRASPQSAP